MVIEWSNSRQRWQCTLPPLVVSIGYRHPRHQIHCCLTKRFCNWRMIYISKIWGCLNWLGKSQIGPSSHPFPSPYPRITQRQFSEPPPVCVLVPTNFASSHFIMIQFDSVVRTLYVQYTALLPLVKVSIRINSHSFHLYHKKCIPIGEPCFQSAFLTQMQHACKRAVRQDSLHAVSVGKSVTQPAGFEPARGDPIGFQVQRLNHSATTAGWRSRCRLYGRLFPTPTFTIWRYSALAMSGDHQVSDDQPDKLD